jgi:hypothetical protein
MSPGPPARSCTWMTCKCDYTKIYDIDIEKYHKINVWTCPTCGRLYYMNMLKIMGYMRAFDIKSLVVNNILKGSKYVRFIIS